MNKPIQYERPFLYPAQREAIFCPERYGVVEASTKSGKAQPLSAKVYTPAGPILMGNVKVGDVLLDSNGGRTRVEGIYPQGVQDIYRVDFSDGTSTECTLDHLWEIHSHHISNPAKAKFRNRTHKSWPRAAPLSEIMEMPEFKLRRTNIPTAAPVDYDCQEIPVDPYLLGALIGDGCLKDHLSISSADDYILDRVRAALPCNHRLVYNQQYDWDIRLDKQWQQMPDRLRVCLKDLGLCVGSHEKFIPDVYKFNSIAVRMEIVRGLFDTDGWVDGRGQPHFDQSSWRLAMDVREIIEGLGGYALYSCANIRGGRDCHKLAIVHPDAPSLFALPRKHDRAKKKCKRVVRKFRSIEFVRREEAQCIQVSGDRNLYLTDHMIVTHNTVGCLFWLIEQAITQPGSRRNYWWVAPTFPVAQIAFRRAQNMLQPREMWSANGSESFLEWLPNGSRIWFKGAERPDNLYGEDVYAAVIDEASRVREESFHAVRSTLTFTRGPLRIIGNVKGRRNWAYALARKAESGAPDMHYSRLTAHDAVKGGVLDADEVADAKRILPAAVFRELYLAEPTDDGSNPFGLEAIDQVTRPMMSIEPTVVHGVDLAKSQDWTVDIGLDEAGMVSHFERYQCPWPETEGQLVRAIGDTPALIDSTGVGDPVVDGLQRTIPNVEGFKFTAQSKQQLMEGLAVAIQKGDVGIVDGPIRSELEDFTYEYTRTGMKYSAPQGMHDDCVCALALAVRKRQGVAPGNIFEYYRREYRDATKQVAA